VKGCQLKSLLWPSTFTTLPTDATMHRVLWPKDQRHWQTCSLQQTMLAWRGACWRVYYDLQHSLHCQQMPLRKFTRRIDSRPDCCWCSWGPTLNLNFLFIRSNFLFKVQACAVIAGPLPPNVNTAQMMTDSWKNYLFNGCMKTSHVRVSKNFPETWKLSA
jgi:hypothetical protein